MREPSPAFTESHRAAGHWRQLYPFESHFLELPNASSDKNSPPSASRSSLQLHYVDHGSMATTVGSGPQGTCLFVHGNPTWSFYWRNLILGLQDQYRCVAVDHLGCGLSDKPQTYPYNLRQHTANLVALIDHLDLRNVALVAHDWGGAIGLGAVVARRERFSSLVLLNTGAFPPPYVPFRIQACRIPVLGTVAIRGFNAFAGAALTMATERPKGLEPLVKAGLIAPYRDWATRVAVDAFVKDIPWRSSHPTFAVLESLEKSLATLATLPIQLIWGMKDWCFTPQCLERFRQHFPQARVLELAQAGHYVVEDQPAEVLQEIRQFLMTRGGSDAQQPDHQSQV
ncbi:MAG: alpha/beta fold hydrolase [Pirellulaceae bacterium]|nr:alpha/beta fold hydrolase [Pirellulaceae bacterium]